MNKLKTYLIIFLLFLLERVFFARFGIFGLTPWLSMAFLLSLSSVTDDFNGNIVLAFVSGLFIDFISGGVFLSATLVFVLMSLFINLLTKKLLRSNFWLSEILIFVAFLMGESVYFLINKAELSEIFGSILLLALINTLISMLFYPIAKRIWKRGKRI